MVSAVTEKATHEHCCFSSVATACGCYANSKHFIHVCGNYTFQQRKTYDSSGAAEVVQYCCNQTSTRICASACFIYLCNHQAHQQWLN